MTLKEFVSRYNAGEKIKDCYYIKTAFGKKYIHHVESDWWVVSGNGFGRQSYSCIPQTEVFLKEGL